MDCLRNGQFIIWEAQAPQVWPPPQQRLCKSSASSQQPVLTLCRRPCSQLGESTHGWHPASSRGLYWVVIEVPSIPSHSVILWFYNSVILACSGEGRISSPNIIKAHLQVCVLMSDAVWDMLHILHLVNDKTILHCMPEF